MASAHARQPVRANRSAGPAPLHLRLCGPKSSLGDEDMSSLGDEVQVLRARLVAQEDAEPALLVVVADAELEVQEAEEPEESHVQDLEAAVVLEDVLLPELQRTGLVQDEAVGKEHQQGTDVRGLVVAHVLVDLVHGLPEVHAGVREREDDVGIAVLAGVHQTDALEDGLAGSLTFGPRCDTLQRIHEPQDEDKIVRVLGETRHVGSNPSIQSLDLVLLQILFVRSDQSCLPLVGLRAETNAAAGRKRII
mmetsp:Transcript_67276/g.197499  ORF Transcript_67276/g.197499 Transcript_67276/m.197499 type:complete len:250 (+) Transcript_67276:203-952(+)